MSEQTRIAILNSIEFAALKAKQTPGTLQKVSRGYYIFSDNGRLLEAVQYAPKEWQVRDYETNNWSNTHDTLKDIIFNYSLVRA